MIEQKSSTTAHINIDDSSFINVIPGATYNVEVWEYVDDHRPHRMGRMDYKFNRDSFAGFIYRLFPGIDFVQIHELQKRINPFFDFEV
ncbi:hypothetical protein [Lacticaseibacillus zhaodongensis]|uniref:hypothetical protein n=1 Tax=Lacticaseibacillus zhaodongensis TaxID=2668065 RepID=UPI0012D30579|nr:hypothetical protein [Lacticaseibacillus zhaodongensis]